MQQLRPSAQALGPKDSCRTNLCPPSAQATLTVASELVCLGQAGGEPSHMQDIHDYFKGRWEAKDAAAEGSTAPAEAPGRGWTSAADADCDDGDKELQITWGPEQWQAAEGLRARVHAAALLANAAADVSAPLITASDLQVSTPARAGTQARMS